MKITKLSLKRYCTFVVVLLPLLGQYGFFTRTITFADIAIIPAIALIIVFNINHGLLINDKIYPLFGLWYILTSLFITPVWTKLFTTGTMASILQNAIYFIVVILIARYYFDCELAFKIYSYVAFILCIIVFVQIVLNLATGAVTPWIINSNVFPAVYTNEDFFSGGYIALIEKSSYRPSSLFSEPALFAQYVTPCLILNIYKKNKDRFNYVVMFLITAAILMAKSANGIIYVLIAWLAAGICSLVNKIKRKELTVKKRYILLGLIIMLLIPQIVQMAINKIFSDDVFSLSQRVIEIFDSKGESSGSMRVVRGWQIYAGLAFGEKIVGIGTGNIVQYLNLHPYIVKMFTSAYNGYMSGLPTIFVNSGIIGGILYIIWWIKYFINRENVVKGMQIFLMLYLLASNSFNTVQFILSTILVISLSKENNMESQFD